MATKPRNVKSRQEAPTADAHERAKNFLTETEMDRLLAAARKSRPPKKTTDKEAADKGADDANNQIGQQTVVPAGYALGNPSSQNTNDDTSDEIHGRLLAHFVLNACAQGPFRFDWSVRVLSNKAGPAALSA